MDYYSLNLHRIHFIVTAGPTREFLDPVRFISNPSSGRMGFEIAMECLKYSPRLTYIHGPIQSQFLPQYGERVAIISTNDLHDRIMEVIDQVLPEPIVLIMAAAPGDYSSLNFSPQKIKKNSEQQHFILKPNPDILKEINNRYGNAHRMLRVGFAAESHHILEYGKSKLREKNLDLIVINDITNTKAGFQSDQNEVVMVGRDGNEDFIQLTGKNKIASILLQKLQPMMLSLIAD